MNKILLSSKSFNINDQKLFSRFSGDINPIHLSENYARMTPPGKPIVHGVNTLLWSLDSIILNKIKISNQINVKFLHPIYLNEEVSCHYFPDEKKLEVSRKDIIFMKVFFRGADHNPVFKEELEKKTSKKLDINNYDLKDILSIQNSCKTIELPKTLDNSIGKRLYQNLDKSVYKLISYDIALISTVVGVQVPGLHSIFVSLNLNLGPNIRENYGTKITKVDERFGIVELSVVSNYISSKIKAIVRPKPIEVLSIKQIANKIDLRSCNDLRILVIGGSRGIGSIVVKILACLGASVTFTYANGEQEAENLKLEISEMGFNVNYIKFDVNQSELLDIFDHKPEYIFYFPTPKIFVKRSKNFEDELYKKFQYFYVDVFEKIYKFSVKNSVKAIFYPSSIAVEENTNEFPEYVKAKKEGEQLCDNLNSFKKVKITSKRLPRTLTDQTSTNLNIKSRDPFDVMMPILEEFLNLKN